MYSQHRLRLSIFPNRIHNDAVLRRAKSDLQRPHRRLRFASVIGNLDQNEDLTRKRWRKVLSPPTAKSMVARRVG